MKAIAVYSATNQVNGKMYIGQTMRPERRFAEHTWNGSKSKIFSAAIKKYGKNNFVFSILCWCPDKEYANMVEKGLIAAYNTRKEGYNICLGGEGFGSGDAHPCFGRKVSDEERKAKSESKKGSLNPMFGKENTPEQKGKISASLKGRKITWGDKISEAKAGIRTCSLEELKRRCELANAASRRKVLAKKGIEEQLFASIRDCAKHFGVHEETIRRYLRNNKPFSCGWTLTKVEANGN